MKLKKGQMLKALLLAVILLFTISSHAQVTIGLGESPEEFATLQLKDLEKANTTLGDITGKKGGFMLPRVKLENKYQLLPFYTGDTTNVNYKTVIKPAHKGLYVYNLVQNDDKELCLGLNEWNGSEWNCFQSKMGNAKFDPVNCSDIIVKGVYVEHTATTSENYLKIKLNVTKVGAFAIKATTGNGYSFYFSGVALSTGVMVVDVPCQGTPVNVQTDKLIFSGLDLVTGCEPTITVASAVATYSLNCSSLVVNGQYIKGRVLTSSNTITLNVTVSVAGSYDISTPLTNGIRFTSSGNFAVGTQPVTLVGTGTPTVNSDFPITVNANTPQGNNTCSAIVPMTLPAMTYAIIGQDVWSWAAAPRLKALSNTGLGADVSFGPNGIVKMLSFSELWRALDAATATTKLNNDAVKPDIVLYFAYRAAPDTDLTTALKNYINKGGCVIYGSADYTSTQVNTLMSGLFGITPATPQSGTSPGNADDQVYPIANIPNDPIVNGPFGNLSGRFWGEDNATTGSVIMTQLPPNSVQICTAQSPLKLYQDPEYSIVWYNNSKNFVYFGDSTGASSTDISSDSYPAKYSSTGLPQSKNYGPAGSDNKRFIYNSALELNAVAWAVRKAAISGINPH